MITTGSVRGKVMAPQAGQPRRQPPSSISGRRAAARAARMGAVPFQQSPWPSPRRPRRPDRVCAITARKSAKTRNRGSSSVQRRIQRRLCAGAARSGSAAQWRRRRIAARPALRRDRPKLQGRQIGQALPVRVAPSPRDVATTRPVRAETAGGRARRRPIAPTVRHALSARLRPGPQMRRARSTSPPENSDFQNS
jgi:hypothetical protein